MKRTTVFGFFSGLIVAFACTPGDCIRNSDCDSNMCVSGECVDPGGTDGTDGTDSGTSTTASTDSAGGTDGTCLLHCFAAAETYNLPSPSTPFPVGTTCPGGIGDLSEQDSVLIPMQAIASVCPIVDQAGAQTIMDACGCGMSGTPPVDPAWIEYVTLFTAALHDACVGALNVAYGCSMGVLETAQLCDDYLVNEVTQRMLNESVDGCLDDGNQGATVPWTCDHEALTCG